MADITIAPPPPDEQIALQGKVIDMSYSGIRIKLTEMMPRNIPESKIKINMVMPNSGIPFTIQGVIKYLSEDSECGFSFDNNHAETELDDFMFECVRCTAAA